MVHKKPFRFGRVFFISGCQVLRNLVFLNFAVEGC